MNLFIDLAFLVAAIWLERKYNIHLFKSFHERIIVTIVIFVILMGWEFVNYLYFQAWVYPGNGMIGLYIYGLPLELYLFFLTSPYFSLIVYELIHKNVDT